MFLIVNTRNGQKVGIGKRKMEELNNRLDEGAVTDSQDEFDHGVHPKDPNIMGYQKEEGGVVIWSGGIRHADTQCPGGTLVSGNGLYMLLR